MTTNHKKRGFTLTETIMVISIFTVLTLGVTTLFTHIFTSTRNHTKALDEADQARGLMTNLVTEIRSATVSASGAFPLDQTDDREIIFYSPYGQKDGPVARYHYYLTDNILYRGITLPAGDPPTYNINAEKIQIVLNQITNIDQPLFEYFDGNYDGQSAPLVQPITADQVRYIKINLNLMTTGASLRNLKDN